jgi:hypothetical protein
MRSFLVSIVLWIGFPCVSFAQPPSEAEASAIRAGLLELQGAVAKLKQQKLDAKLVADVEIYAKAVEWALRHNEF